MRGLGRLFDIGCGWSIIDLNTNNGNNSTEKRVSMENASGITFVVLTDAGGADDLVLDIQQHTAYTGGTSADLDSTAVSDSTGITKWYIKAETALDGDEAWTAVTQTEASECTVAGATYGAMQKLVAIHVAAHQLGAGYTHLSLTATCVTAAAQLACCLYVIHDLKQQRDPANMANMLNPGAANA